jgi:hypothetical protein
MEAGFGHFQVGPMASLIIRQHDPAVASWINPLRLRHAGLASRRRMHTWSGTDGPLLAVLLLPAEQAHMQVRPNPPPRDIGKDDLPLSSRLHLI